MIEVIKEKCNGCGVCVDKCPFDAIYLNQGIAEIDKEKCNLCGICVKNCDEDAIVMEKNETGERKDTSEYKGVWVLCEQKENELLDVSLELVSEGRKLADDLNTELSGVILGSSLNKAAEEVIANGADKVYVIEDDELGQYRTGPYTKMIEKMINKYKPEIVLLGATPNGRDLGPRVSARINTGLTADCTKLEISQEEKFLLQTRPAFGGNLMATIVCKENRPQMATVRPGVMVKNEPDYERVKEIEKFELDFEKDALPESGDSPQLIKLNVKFEKEDILTKILNIVKEAEKSIELENAEIIVAGGRGVGSPDNFDIIKDFAQVIGGEVGASRAVVDEGWIDKEHQVGQTGKTVHPKLYIACGISGAIQHQAGMKESENIVAINTDPDASIFDICDYGIVGDLHEVLPVLKEIIKKEIESE